MSRIALVMSIAVAGLAAAGSALAALAPTTVALANRPLLTINAHQNALVGFRDVTAPMRVCVQISRAGKPVAHHSGRLPASSQPQVLRVRMPKPLPARGTKVTVSAFLVASDGTKSTLRKTETILRSKFVTTASGVLMRGVCPGR